MRPRTIPALDRSAASTACRRTAATPLDPPFEVLAIPFGGATLPGYLLKPDASGTPRPALLMLGSSDTVVEDLYAYIDPAGLRRSYSAHVVDLPGQGPAVCGLVMRPARQGADARGGALGRPESDSKRLAAYRHRRRIVATSFGI
jgi:hypothetical protein